MMNNEEAYNFYTTNSLKGFSQISREFIEKYDLNESDFDFFRIKFTQLKGMRMTYSKEKDLDTWNSICLLLPLQIHH